MTERLYYTSDNTEGQANLLSCSAEPDGRYAVVLDRTLFHPQGGGQPADAGWIDGERVETVLASGDDVVHIVAKPLLPGIVNLCGCRTASTARPPALGRTSYRPGGYSVWLAPGESTPLAQ